MDAKKDSLNQLLRNLHTDLGREATAEGKFAMHGMLADYLLDASRPVRGTKPQIIAHIKERTAPSYSYGINRRSRALGLYYQSARGKIILRNNKDATAFIANDAENSGLLLLDVSISRVLEKRMGKFVGSTYNMFARLTSMNSKRYYPGVENQHAEYMHRCMQFPKAFHEKFIKVDELIGLDGIADVTKFEDSVALHLEGTLSKDMLAQLFEICSEKNTCLRFKTIHPAEGRTMLEQHPEVMPHMTDPTGNVTYQYTPAASHPAYPLVSGPEDDVALAKVENLLEHWIMTEALTEDHSLMDPLTKIDQPATTKDKPPIVADCIKVDEFIDPPAPVRDILYKALKLPANQTKAFLDHCKITAANGEIFSIYSGNHLPSLVVKATREAVSATYNPGALEILMRVHWALTTKALYTADVHPRLPKQPWYAALFLIIRQPVRYNMKGLVHDPRSGDWVHPAPRKSAMKPQEGSAGAALLATPTDWNAVVEAEEQSVAASASSAAYNSSAATFVERRPRSRSRPRVQFDQDAINLHYSSRLPPPPATKNGRGGRGRGMSMRARGGMPRGGGMGRASGRAPVDLGALVAQMQNQFSLQATAMNALQSDLAEMKEKAAQAAQNNM